MITQYLNFSDPPRSLRDDLIHRWRSKSHQLNQSVTRIAMIALLCVIHLLIFNPSLANAAPALVQTATASNQLATPADTVSTDTSLALSTEMEIFDERPYFFFSLMAKVATLERFLMPGSSLTFSS